nr:putative ribonuclease H-like domain-containing protein [Tanacetum cinerariifolium]
RHDYDITVFFTKRVVTIEFLQNKPIVAGIKDSIGAGQSNIETGSTQGYYFMPLWNDSSPIFNSSPKISRDAGKKHAEVLDKESRALNELNFAFENLNTEYRDDPKMPGLETIATYDDSEEESDFTNLESSIHASPTFTTRTHKNHSLKQRELPEELLKFKLQKMYMKSAFLYGRVEEEVYVYQPLGFEDPNHPKKVYKVVKAIYGLHQAPRAWYETLANYLLGNGFHRGKIDHTLFIKWQKGDILLVRVYVDGIIFGSTKKGLCTEFKRLMKDTFQM